MVRYTEKLLEKGAERKRLTNQLAEMVGKVADEIAQNAPEGAVLTSWRSGKPETSEKTKISTITLNGSLEIIRFTSVESDVLMIAINVNTFKEDKDDDYIWEEHVITTGVEPGERFYLHGDVSTPVRSASKKDYLDFANNLPNIIAAFEESIDKENLDMKKAFEVFKEMVTTERKAGA